MRLFLPLLKAAFLALSLHPADGQETRDDSSSLPLSFRNDVLPILSGHGCASGACHAKAEGQNGFHLTVFAYDPASDYREIVHNARGRRVFPAAPEQSLLILKATNRIPHEGGEAIPPGSASERILLEWIRQGMPWEAPNEPSLEEISVTPAEKQFEKGESRSLKVTAHFSDESSRDVTALSEFSSPDTAFATVNEHGKVLAGTARGEGVIVARYLDHVALCRVTIPPDRRYPEARYADLPIANEIDRLAWKRLQTLGLLPSDLCSDSEFIRRATLDVLGHLPHPDRAKAFLQDKNPEKRSRLIDELLSEENSAAYADYWSTKWGDLLRPNTQRVGVKPVYLLDDWIRRQFRQNTPWDVFVRELMTAQGSTHEYGPVALWRDKRDPADMAEFTSRIFLGIRLDCAKCHHHPSEKWGQEDYYSLAAFFASMKRKGQGISPPISGEPEYWWFQPGQTPSVEHPVTGDSLVPTPPDGERFPEIPSDVDPREKLLDWMVSSPNSTFSRAAVNRIWGHLFGRGIVHPVDDFRASNPAANEALLDWLAEEFQRLDYDRKALLRVILNSQLYQLSSLPGESNLSDRTHFSRFYRRRLPAEVLLDAVSDLTGRPEAFQGLPGESRAVQQWNHKLSSDFLDVFGRPDSSADCPCERDLSSSVVQALHLMNSEQLQKKLQDDSGWVAKLASSPQHDPELVEEIYLRMFSRVPSKEEIQLSVSHLANPGFSRREAIEDLLWSLLNSAEFVLNH